MDSGKAFTEVVMEAVVIRADGTRESLGVVSYWHKNPLKRMLYRIKQAWRKYHGYKSS